MPITIAQSRDTDPVVAKLCNDKLNLKPNISIVDIERSHIIGPVRDNTATIICKFKLYKTKQTVFMNKNNLKHHKNDNFNVFITKDLTKQRQTIVKHLNKARIDHNIRSFWSNDGRTFYKTAPKGEKHLFENWQTLQCMCQNQYQSLYQSQILISVKLTEYFP